MTAVMWFAIIIAMLAAGLYLAMTVVHWFVHWLCDE